MKIKAAILTLTLTMTATGAALAAADNSTLLTEGFKTFLQENQPRIELSGGEKLCIAISTHKIGLQSQAVTKKATDKFVFDERTDSYIYYTAYVSVEGKKTGKNPSAPYKSWDDLQEQKLGTLLRATNDKNYESCRKSSETVLMKCQELAKKDPAAFDTCISSAKTKS